MISASPSQAPSAGDPAASLALPWVVRLRYGMVAGEIAVVLGMYYGLRIGFPLRWALMPLAVALASNVLLGRLGAFPVRVTQNTLGAVFCLDTLCLTAMLGFTGGATNPFSSLYLVQITLSAVVLQKTWTWILGALSTAGFGLLFFVRLPAVEFAPHHFDEGFSPHLIGMWIAFVVAAALITVFTGKISDALRKREQDVLILQEQVAKNERLASLVTLAAGAAHELGTPLGTIAIVAKELEHYAAKVAEDDAVLGDSRLIRSEVDRCRRILERMSAQSAEPMGEAPARIGLRDLLVQVSGQFPEARRALLDLQVAAGEIEAVLPVRATVQSLVALVQNALDASSGTSAVTISARTNDSLLVIAVRDQGHGMPASVLRRIAEPFFTTKEPGKGMGLGTFLVRTFAESLGGRVSFDSVPGKGTTVTVELPLHAPGGAHVAA
ncbi:MAG TPA: ATP-binding protein [Bryobacteraceae bacterium]|nr:ATP-binding protein [Bryobacteraceae bacterium]HUO30523.1 ATP-binding protein [Bryobacteraceae bacterium]